MTSDLVMRVCRGTCWFNDERYAPSVCRGWINDEHLARVYSRDWYYLLGFRTALSGRRAR